MRGRFVQKIVERRPRAGHCGIRGDVGSDFGAGGRNDTARWF